MINVKSSITKEERNEFDRLCGIEPQLRALLDEAIASKDDGTKDWYCANRVWYGGNGYPGIKPRILRLVGWEAGTPERIRNTLNIPDGPRLITLADIGPEAREDASLRREVHPDLKTERAYRLAYEVLYDALSYCRNCGCP
jgi:hypothetical protein